MRTVALWAPAQSPGPPLGPPAVPPWSLSEAPPDSAAFDHLGKDAKPGVTVYPNPNPDPNQVATHQDAGCTHEGHPTIVEAGVCLGGKDARSDKP